MLRSGSSSIGASSRRLGDVRDRLEALAPLDRLQERVAEGREEVRTELDGGRVELVEARQGPHERLLDEVVRVVRVPAQALRERVEPGEYSA